MKRALRLVTALLIGCGLLAGCTTTPQGSKAAPYVIKLHHDLLESSPQHLAAVHWAEAVAEQTEGRVEVHVYPANQLGDDREAVEMLMIGNLQAAIIPTAKLSLFVPQMQMPDLPFLFPSAKIAHQFLDGPVGQELLAASAPIGLKGVGFWESGFKQFTGNRSLLSVQDFKGLKFRTMESPVVIEQFRALGANPLPISFSETYNALQQGVVDGQENPLVSIVSMRFYEVQSHVTLSNHAYLGYAFLFSQDWWEQVPADLQQILLATLKESTRFQREETARQEESFVQTLQASKSKVELLPEANRPAFEAATRPVHELFAPSIGPALMQKAYAEIERLKNLEQ